MRNPDIAAVPAAGDVAGLEAAYAAYGDLVHDQVGWRLRAAAPGPTPNATVDTVHDTFMIAFASPRRPTTGSQLLRPWLLAIARNECLHVLAAIGPAPARAVLCPPPAPVPTPPCSALERDVGAGPKGAGPPNAGLPDAGLPDVDLRAMVGLAAAELDARDRELLELGLRLRLSAPEIGLILGVPPGVASAALDRVGSRFCADLGALVLARAGSTHCRRLRRSTRTAGPASPAWRRRVLRHVDGCAGCSAERAERVDPPGILRLPAYVPASPAVGRWIFADAADPRIARERQALAERAGPWRSNGFPVPVDSPARAPRGDAPLPAEPAPALVREPDHTLVLPRRVSLRLNGSRLP